MKIEKLKDMKGGWFIGNFEPSVHKSEDFEIAVHEHKKDEVHDNHYHKISTEINVLLSGELSLDGGKTFLNSGDIFTIYPEEIVYPVFKTDCKIVVVKIPSSIDDKYIV